MFIERKINQATNIIELWRCEWENRDQKTAKKVYLSKIGEEQPEVPKPGTPMAEEPAICWSYGRTIGNIAVFSPSILGQFPGKEGADAQLPCDFVHAGKFRHGQERWWCRTHQTHWGTKADIIAAGQYGEIRCGNHLQKMHYVVSPLTIDVRQYAEIGVWCSMPAAISTHPIPQRPPKIHVHVRKNVNDSKKIVDRDFAAISIQYEPSLNLFENLEINRVNITPPAAFEFVRGLELKQDMDCTHCSHCHYPHLDLGDFARKPHRKHFCGNCGRDSTWTNPPMISTPLQPLHDSYAKTLTYETPNRVLDLDEYKGCSYTVWASTPAIVWTAARPQEFGIHVHVHDGTRRIVDDTFGEVRLDGKPLERAFLIENMMSRTIV